MIEKIEMFSHLNRLNGRDRTLVIIEDRRLTVRGVRDCRASLDCQFSEFVIFA